MRTIMNKRRRASKVVIAVAVGVGIAIAIVAAGEGVDEKINTLLDTHGSVNLKATGIDLGKIQSVLTFVRNLLLLLSTIYTVASVGMVMWASMPQRRREISIARIEGQHRISIVIELGIEAFILCGAGGVLGVLLGKSLCHLVFWWEPSLPMNLSFRAVATVFPVTVGATFGMTMVMAFLLAATFGDPDR